jgi:hypothetical protein
MNHLTEEQLEDILQGGAGVPEHLDRCAQCRARLEEKRALAKRVHRAFSSIHADSGLADRIRARIAAAGQPPAEAEAQHQVLPFRARRHIWSGLAIAAAILIVLIPRSLHISTGPQATAAQVALAGIHFTNLDSLEEIMAEEDSGKHCPCMTGMLADGTAMPCCQRGLCKCGCQMREFQGRLVESCVIQEPNAPPVSVVIVPESPEALGMARTDRTTATGQAVWQATCEHCNIASVRLGNDSCCVIGQVSQEDLLGVLNVLAE